MSVCVTCSNLVFSAGMAQDPASAAISLRPVAVCWRLQYVGSRLTLVLRNMNVNCCYGWQLQPVVSPSVCISAWPPPVPSIHCCMYSGLPLSGPSVQLRQLRRDIPLRLRPNAHAATSLPVSDAHMEGHSHACARAPAINDENILGPWPPEQHCAHCCCHLQASHQRHAQPCLAS